MKNLILFFIYLFAIHSVQSQKISLKEYFEKQEASVNDTVMCLKSSDSIWADLPMTLIKGREKGPTLTIAAGIRQGGFPAAASLLELRREINPQKLKGNLIIIPDADVQRYDGRSSGSNPIGISHLNDAFPGSHRGTAAELIADFVATAVFDATDVFLELNSCDAASDPIDFICYYDNSEFMQQTMLEFRLSEASGLDTILSHPYVLSSGEPSKCAVKQAARLGIPSLSMTVGGQQKEGRSGLSPARDALYRIMAELQLYTNRKIKPARAPKHRFNRKAFVKVPFQGIFYSSVKAGDKIKENQQIGYLADIFGNRIKTLTAPQSGTVLYKTEANPVNSDETVFCIGYRI
ncbi:succinylglutamate desuccinylase/aspartoacylase family protein [Flavobacterium quisquiliarum]|uniref:Succinylglutamate desuccinylase/aspartoacylase family protein n=1 Tax=Flavobacterium quisquiliarum TaxID=1834436 RepID=A0ABV8W024_9FLAO|nr:succinylglutamate desuccinylase/aspartoacylase family protein [Flavobacterium quisquiliarum]MBW1658639.1 hypothetical protein [Flavobacterium quisquiliarum]